MEHLLARLALVLFAVFLYFSFKSFVEILRCAWVLRKVPSPPVAGLISGHVDLLTDETGARRLAQWGHVFNGVFRLRTYWKQVKKRS
jgi:hypothetical protein